MNDANQVNPDLADADPSEASPIPEGSSKRALYRQCAADHFRTRLHISYDGTDFCGWQRQPSEVTVQGTLEGVLTKIYGKPITVLGASRTDSGVHAYQQVAHFDAPRDPELFDLRYAMQCLTPDSIVIKEVFLAAPDFHAIACVEDKIYKYQVLNRRVPSALRSRYTYWVRFPLDLDFLNETSQFLIGKQDFRSFQGTGADVKSTVRTLSKATWERIDNDTLEFTVQGDGFLKQMIRNVVGTLILLNKEGQKPERMREIIAFLDRRRAGPTAPPQGLFLSQVNYPESIDNKCRKL